MGNQHIYQCQTIWTGNRGKDTASYKAYDRNFDQIIDGKPILPGSADPTFLGDATRHNPEDLLLASLSSCHMLWYLHLCAVHDILVRSYCDNAEGQMVLNPDGSGQFEAVTLKPVIGIVNMDKAGLAISLHAEANQKCFIARSMNFAVHHMPKLVEAQD